MTKKANSESKENKVKNLIEKLEDEMNALFKGEKGIDVEAYRNYLKIMSRFHKYSFRNSLLIRMQNPDATYVAGYQTWINSFNRHVKKGETGIAIIAPIIKKEEHQIQSIDPKTNKPAVDELMRPIMEAVEREQLLFTVTYVFDISQTDGQPLPEFKKIQNLNGNAQRFEILMSIFHKISPYPISFENLEFGNGYCSYSKRKIVVNEGMSEIHTIKTTIHEMAHAILHSKDFNDTNRAEVEAESIAYVISQYFGIDTSDYSFPYIANWSNWNDIDILKQSLQVIQKESSNLISAIENELSKIQELENVSTIKDDDRTLPNKLVDIDPDPTELLGQETQVPISARISAARQAQAVQFSNKSPINFREEVCL